MSAYVGPGGMNLGSSSSSSPINYGALGGAAEDIFSGVGSVLSGQAAAKGYATTYAGEEVAAGQFGLAEGLALQNANESKAAGALTQVQLARQVSQVQGQETAIAAGNGLRLGGSAGAIIRSTASQGALASQLQQTQTNINVNGFLTAAQADQAEQQQAYNQAAAAKQAESGAAFGEITGGLKAAVGIGLSAAAII